MNGQRPRTTSSTTPVTVLPGFRLPAFVLLSYAISWAGLLPLLATGSVVTPGVGWPTHFPALLGPLLAAAAITAATGQWPSFAAALVRVRVAARWWLVALSPLAILGLTLAGLALTGINQPDWSGFARVGGLPAGLGIVGVALIILLVNGFGEEAGWRGFALPALQTRLAPLPAIGVLTVIWAGWHLPMFAVLATFKGFGPVTMTGWLIGLACGSVVLSWLYNKTGSIALAAVFHATYTLASATAAAQGTIAAVVSTAVIVQAMLLVGLEWRAKRRGLPLVLGPPA